MTERRVEVKTFEVDYACDVDGCDGLMRPTGMSLMSHPPKFTHACTVCGARRAFDVRYPALIYRRVQAGAGQ